MKEYNDFVRVLVNDAPAEEFYTMLESFANMEMIKRMEFVDRMSGDPRISSSVIRKHISEFESNEELMEIQEAGLRVANIEESDIDRLRAQAESMEGIIETLNDDITMTPVRFALYLNRFAVNVANAEYIITMYTNVAKAIKNGTINGDLED